MFGSRPQTIEMLNIRQFDPRDNMSNERDRTEAKLLDGVADLALAGDIQFVMDPEVRWEFAGLRDTYSPQKALKGATITLVHPPVNHSRLLVDGHFVTGADSLKVKLKEIHDLQERSLEALDHPRYVAIRRALGHVPGSKNSRNILADAFHLWCAEVGEADYFLTLDGRLINGVRGDRKLKLSTRLVWPSGLLSALATPEEA